jgi:hypothetical protein
MPVRSRLFSTLIFAVLILGVAIHVYRNPEWDIDMFVYIGSAMAFDGLDPAQIHSEIYQRIVPTLPREAADRLTGRQAGASDSQNRLLADRARDAYHFAEFLPYHAIRPLYIEFLRLLHKLGLAYVPASLLMAVGPFVALAFLIYYWMLRYVASPAAAALTLLLFVSPATLSLARYPGPDCFSTLVQIAALYLLLEKRLLGLGCVLLLLSVWIRTDNAILVLFTLAFLWFTRQLRFHQALILGALAVASVFAINHFAGHFGMRMMYWAVFKRSEIAPAEFFPPPVSIADYLHALRSGITTLAAGFFIPYLFMGVTGYFARRNLTLYVFGLLAAANALSHFLLFPFFQDRYYGVYYLAMGLLAAACAAPSIISSSPRN